MSMSCAISGASTRQELRRRRDRSSDLVSSFNLKASGMSPGCSEYPAIVRNLSYVQFPVFFQGSSTMVSLSQFLSRPSRRGVSCLWIEIRNRVQCRKVWLTGNQAPQDHSPMFHSHFCVNRCLLSPCCLLQPKQGGVWLCWDVWLVLRCRSSSSLDWKPLFEECAYYHETELLDSARMILGPEKWKMWRMETPHA